MKKIIIIIIIIIIMFITYFGFWRSSQLRSDGELNQSKKKPIPLRVGTIKAFSGLPLFVALEEHYFKEEEFDITYKQYRTSDLVFSALEIGEIDLVGCAGMAQSLRLGAQKPNLFKILGVLYSSTCLMVPKESDIHTLKDLEGKEIGCFPGSVFITYSREAFKAANLDVSKITLIPFPPSLQLQALQKSQIDALYTLEPTGAIAQAAEYASYLTDEDLFSKYFLEDKAFPGGCVALRQSFISKYPDSPKAIIKIFRKSTAMIESHDFYSSKYLKGHTPIPSEFVPQLRPMGADFGSNIDTDSLQKLVGYLKSWNLIESQFNVVDRLMFNEK